MTLSESPFLWPQPNTRGPGRVRGPRAAKLGDGPPAPYPSLNPPVPQRHGLLSFFKAGSQDSFAQPVLEYSEGEDAQEMSIQKENKSC